jgi:CDGSH iron-sulfur domain-containing protein 3
MEKPMIPQRAPYVIATEPGEYWWCACGRSATQPFCDGSHKGTGLSPVRTEVKEAGRLAWCGCKHSAGGAFCDGTHRTVT